MSKNTTTKSGVSGTTLLIILLIGLKLTGHIDWSWWWVLSPIWISIAILLTVGLFMLVAAIVSTR